MSPSSHLVKDDLHSRGVRLFSEDVLSSGGTSPTSGGGASEMTSATATPVVTNVGASATGDVCSMLRVLRAFHTHVLSQLRHVGCMMLNPRHVGFHLNPWSFHDSHASARTFFGNSDVGMFNTEVFERADRYADCCEAYGKLSDALVTNIKLYHRGLTECAPLLESSYYGGPRVASLDFGSELRYHASSTYDRVSPFAWADCEDVEESVLAAARDSLANDRRVLFESRYIDVTPFRCDDDGGFVEGGGVSSDDGVEGVLCALADRLLSFVDYCLASDGESSTDENLDDNAVPVAPAEFVGGSVRGVEPLVHAPRVLVRERAGVWTSSSGDSSGDSGGPRSQTDPPEPPDLVRHTVASFEDLFLR